MPRRSIAYPSKPDVTWVLRVDDVSHGELWAPSSNLSKRRPSAFPPRGLARGKEQLTCLQPAGTLGDAELSPDARNHIGFKLEVGKFPLCPERDEPPCASPTPTRSASTTRCSTEGDAWPVLAPGLAAPAQTQGAACAGAAWGSPC
jgi:hypothetical protein